jgi:hypothetical protein
MRSGLPGQQNFTAGSVLFIELLQNQPVPKEASLCKPAFANINHPGGTLNRPASILFVFAVSALFCYPPAPPLPPRTGTWRSGRRSRHQANRSTLEQTRLALEQQPDDITRQTPP